MRIDVVIFGGGGAGLWLLDVLARCGSRAVLLESRALGHGQTAAAQGIVHGGLKYSLGGMLTGAAAAVWGMPLLWRECLAGRREPDLRQVRLRAEFCHLWRTGSAASCAGMLGARLGLRVAPQPLGPAERPAVLAGCPGAVMRLDEPVVSTVSLVEALARRHEGRILMVKPEGGCEFQTCSAGRVEAVRLTDSAAGLRLTLRPRHVVLTAGAGNAGLREQLGLDPRAMQRRPLHMALVRGPLPVLNGHCVDGARTRVTVTSDTDAEGRTVWQLGGQLAEDGVRMEPAALVRHAREELVATIPGLGLREVEWGTYRVDRAEGANVAGMRPDTPQVLREGNVLTAWPTKLALAPRLAEEVAAVLAPEPGGKEVGPPLELPEDWPHPAIALQPWEACREWYTLEGVDGRAGRVA